MKKTYQGTCHCGHVRFEVTADIDHVRICDCSICRTRGALIHRIPEQDMRLITPLENLTLYQWGTFTGADYFCPTCGILPFRRPSAPTEQEIREGVEAFEGWAINTRCLVGFDIDTVAITKIAGREI